MNVFNAIILVIALVIIACKSTIVIADHYKSKEIAQAKAEFIVAEHESTIKACAEGRTTHIRYNGVNCKIN